MNLHTESCGHKVLLDTLELIALWPESPLLINSPFPLGLLHLVFYGSLMKDKQSMALEGADSQVHCKSPRGSGGGCGRGESDETRWRRERERCCGQTEREEEWC